MLYGQGAGTRTSNNVLYPPADIKPSVASLAHLDEAFLDPFAGGFDIWYCVQ
jgi:hypothetical protein